MSVAAESIGVVWLVKWFLALAGGTLVGFFMWVTRMNHVKLQNTPSRTEVSDMIDDKHTLVQADLGGKFDRLIEDIGVIKLQYKDIDKQISKMNIELAVTNNEIANIKEQIKTK